MICYSHLSVADIDKDNVLVLRHKERQKEKLMGSSQDFHKLENKWDRKFKILVNALMVTGDVTGSNPTRNSPATF